MGYGTRLEFEAQRTVGFAAIGAGYGAIGTAFLSPARLIMIDNLTDADLQFSFDGTNDHFVLAAMSGKIFDVATNRVQDKGYFVAEGTIVSVQQIGVPTSGTVYVSIAFSPGD